MDKLRGEEAAEPSDQQLAGANVCLSLYQLEFPPALLEQLGRIPLTAARLTAISRNQTLCANAALNPDQTDALFCFKSTGHLRDVFAELGLPSAELEQVRASLERDSFRDLSEILSSKYSRHSFTVRRLLGHLRKSCSGDLSSGGEDAIFRRTCRLIRLHSASHP